MHLSIVNCYQGNYIVKIVKEMLVLLLLKVPLGMWEARIFTGLQITSVFEHSSSFVNITVNHESIYSVQEIRSLYVI